MYGTLVRLHCTQNTLNHTLQCTEEWKSDGRQYIQYTVSSTRHTMYYTPYTVLNAVFPSYYF